MRLKVSHTTRYNYDHPVGMVLQQVRLTPCDGPMQKVLDWSVEVEGGETQLSFEDHFGNTTHLISAESGQESISLTASGEVETFNSTGILGKSYGKSPLWLYLMQTQLTEPGKQIRKLASDVRNASDKLSALHALSQAIIEHAKYRKGETFVGTSAEDALTAGSGVCQDHAQIFVSAARHAGISARYVSGYLMMNERVEQEASHAWAEAHIDSLGWVGFDVSNRISPDERYVRLAVGLDSRDAAPVRGMRFGSATESMIVSVQVQQ